MRYLKLFESQSIEAICSKYGIDNYQINADGTMDVNGCVNLWNKKLNKIPLKFGEVSGWFYCNNNKLSDLIGSPKRVGRMFDCDDNKNLTSLEGCPTYIGGGFWCRYNTNLWSMDHFPRHAKGVYLEDTPIQRVFYLFSDVYEKDGGKFFSTSGTMMDFFWDCDPVYPGGVIKKRRMNNFLSSINKELTDWDIMKLKKRGWKIED